jgi:hypothetical protein
MIAKLKYMLMFNGSMREPDIGPIDSAEIMKVMTGKEFMKRLGKAAEITWETDHDTGFSVARDIYRNRLLYGDVVGFDAENEFAPDPTNSVLGTYFRSVEPVADRLRLNSAYNDFYPVIRVHMHPWPNTFNPSQADIELFLSTRDCLYRPEYARRIDCRPIFAIGSLPSLNKDLELLLLQETRERPLGENYADMILSNIEEEPTFEDYNPAIARICNKQADMQAAMLTYEKNDDHYALKKSDFRLISRFASEPKIINQGKKA